jgi:hypothetical protein
MLSHQFENFTPHTYGALGDEGIAMSYDRKFDGPGSQTNKFEGMGPEKEASASEVEYTGHQ